MIYINHQQFQKQFYINIKAIGHRNPEVTILEASLARPARILGRCPISSSRQYACNHENFKVADIFVQNIFGDPSVAMTTSYRLTKNHFEKQNLSAITESSRIVVQMASHPLTYSLCLITHPSRKRKRMSRLREFERECQSRTRCDQWTHPRLPCLLKASSSPSLPLYANAFTGF